MKKHQHKFKLHRRTWHQYGITARVESIYKCVICGKMLTHDGVDVGYTDEKGRRIYYPFFVGHGRAIIKRKPKHWWKKLKKVM